MLVNHLTLVAPDCYQRLGTFAQMNPPIRDARHRDGIWRALDAGIVDVIGTDHAPHTREEKARPYPQSPSGMPGVQTLIPVMLDHVECRPAHSAALHRLDQRGSSTHLQYSGQGPHCPWLRRGFLGGRPEGEAHHHQRDWMKTKCGWTPFDGMEVTGWPKATIVRGRIVMRDDELIGTPIGKPVRFQETLQQED